MDQTEELVNQIRTIEKLCLEGKTIIQISESVNMSTAKISSILYKINLKTKKSRQPKRIYKNKHSERIGKIFGHLKILSINKYPNSRNDYGITCECTICNKVVQKHLHPVITGSIKHCGSKECRKNVRNLVKYMILILV